MHPSIHPSICLFTYPTIYPDIPKTFTVCLFVQGSMLGPVWDAELKKMCFQIGYNIIREITPLPPQWSLPTECKYSVRVGMGYLFAGR